jgi:hypothetical protein
VGPNASHGLDLPLPMPEPTRGVEWPSPEADVGARAEAGTGAIAGVGAGRRGWG